MPTTTVIDADGHVFEPEDLWEQHLEATYRDRRPRIVRDNRGTTRYLIEGRLIPPGEGRGAWVPHGVVEESCLREGGVDPKARLADMDTDGIDVAVLYPTIALGLYALQDPGLTAALCRAYNDWLASYCAADPARLKGTPALPLQRPEDARREAERAVGELGFVALTMPTTVVGRPPDSPVNDWLYALAQDLDVPVSFHAGGGNFCNDRFVDNYAVLHALEFPFDLMYVAATVVTGGVLERHPRLRVSFLEAGAGWVPYLFGRLDEHYEKRPGEMAMITKAPSEYLRDGRVFVSCEPEEPGLAETAAWLGSGPILYASDYPHWDAEFPGSVAAIRDRPELGDDLKAAVLGGNARRYLGVDW